MHKMLFNTGVQYYNHLDKNGKLIQREHEEWVNSSLHIAYYLEEKPKDSYRLDYLVGEKYLTELRSNQVAIRIIDGGMLSDYAVFTDIAYLKGG